jgi:hypothetical protein
MHERPAFVPGWWTLGIDCAVVQASRPSFSWLPLIREKFAVTRALPQLPHSCLLGFTLRNSQL